MASALLNTLPRSSCGKCVKVLKDLISGLDDSNNDRVTDYGSNHQQKTPEPPPLTLLRAIARSSQQHPHHDQWGQELRHRRRRRQEQHFEQRTTQNNNSLDDNYATRTSSRIREQPGGGGLPPPLLKIEETEDGVRLTIPVETTAPALMKRWTQLKQQDASYGNVGEEEEQEEEQLVQKENGDYTHASHDELLDDFLPLATSVRSDSSSSSPSPSSAVNNPLTIELKCRRCETTGPEAGARAFLMGPEPLSIVLCHNRIHSDADEVEEILTHELIHLYDVQTLQLDLADCETVAYSEVRAAREAECARGVVEAAREAAAATAANKSDNQGQEAASTGGSNNNNNNNSKSKSKNTSNHRWPPPLTGMQNAATNLKESISENVIRPYCVKGIALGATQNMFPIRGKACLNKVWETAYADHRPFSRKQQGSTSGNADDDADSTEQNQRHSQRRATGHSGTSHGTSSK
mmetsp:Transcript_13418/g.37763  ORF Transcript_13418/g.37763 Transcript_13418/m.37763 type:complete len:464 (-) Transcript_13418:499-1890(-)|eukprot:CAMPEP_0172359476 /NCGR_PEP_ID=MMETSP1060-20121228/3672_1 /TAXON_ID=37318 /ORGANISM="Pseudo-nitzschia pungens, Strain cf. cingulata" /LENGTH=463 /DNA_ID=CAMNT_0013081141 /DNA_START=144 /DNA_END=1535 /DNA_ORIENTATION=-